MLALTIVPFLYTYKYRVVKCFQSELAGKKLNKDFSISKKLNGDVDIIIPISSLLVNEEDEHYTRIKTALRNLQRKTIEYEDGKSWTSFNLIIKPRINKYDHNIKLRLHEEIYSTLDNRTKDKIDYVLKILRETKIVKTNLAKKLTNWEFYELLIETGNTYRVIVFTIDDRNITLSTKIVLLNGFIKKSNNYIKQLNRSRTIKENFMKYEYE